jgi:hypothetical protein
MGQRKIKKKTELSKLWGRKNYRLMAAAKNTKS